LLLITGQEQKLQQPAIRSWVVVVSRTPLHRHSGLLNPRTTLPEQRYDLGFPLLLVLVHLAPLGLMAGLG
jgi:hypothetical protein